MAFERNCYLRVPIRLSQLFDLDETMNAPEPTKVMISYSHKDADWLKRLQVQLRPLERRGLIDRWDDTRIGTGQKWQKEIEGALASAKVAVLLISGDFLASNFIADNELPPLLEAAENNGTHIIPINISPSLVSAEPLSQFQAINGPDDPVIGMALVKQEETFRDAARAILELVDPL